MSHNFDTNAKPHKKGSPRRPCGSASGQSWTCVKGNPDGEASPNGKSGRCHRVAPAT